MGWSLGNPESALIKEEFQRAPGPVKLFADGINGLVRFIVCLARAERARTHLERLAEHRQRGALRSPG